MPQVVDDKRKKHIKTELNDHPRNKIIKNRKNVQKTLSTNNNKHAGSKGLVVAIVIILIIISFFGFITWSVIEIRSQEIDDISNLISKSQQGNRSLHMLVKFFQIYENLKNKEQTNENTTQELIYNTTIPIESIQNIDQDKQEQFFEPFVKEIIKFIDGLLGIENNASKNFYNDILLRQAYIKERNRLYSESIEYFQQFLQENPGIGDSLKADIFLHIGFNHAVQNNFEQARNSFREVYRLTDENSDTHKTAIRIEAIMNKLEKAQLENEKRIEELKSDEELNIDKLIATYNSLINTNDYNRIISLAPEFINKNLNKVEEETPLEDKWRIANSAVYYYWGRALEEQGGEDNIDEALKKYRKTIDIGKTQDIEDNKVKLAYERIKLNTEFFGIESETAEEIKQDETFQELEEQNTEFSSYLEKAINTSRGNDTQEQNNIQDDEESIFNINSDLNDISTLSTFDEEIQSEIDEVKEKIDRESDDDDDQNDITDVIIAREEETDEDEEENIIEETEEDTTDETDTEEDTTDETDTEEDTTDEETEEETTEEDTTDEETEEETTEEDTTDDEQVPTNESDSAREYLEDNVTSLINEFTNIDLNDRFDDSFGLDISEYSLSIDIEDPEYNDMVNLETISDYVNNLIDDVEIENKEYYLAEEDIYNEELDERLQSENRTETIENLINNAINEERLKMDIDEVMSFLIKQEDAEQVEIEISLTDVSVEIKNTFNDESIEVPLDELNTDYYDIDFKDDDSMSIKLNDEESSIVNLVSISEDLKEVIESTGNYRELKVKIVSKDGKTYEGKVVKQKDNYYIIEYSSGETVRIFKKDVDTITITDDYENILSIVGPKVLSDDDTTIYEFENLVQGQAYLFILVDNTEIKGVFIKVKGDTLIITELNSYSTISLSKNNVKSAKPIDAELNDDEEDTSNNSEG
jgi:hypothetical protein